MWLFYEPRRLHYAVLILAFLFINNVLESSQYEFRLVPVKSIDRAGPSLGKMKKLRNAGHILCLKHADDRREFCEKAFRKLPQLSSNYKLENGTPGNEFAYRIVYANQEKPQVVFACACPTDPIGIFLMGWVNHKDSVVEVLDYQSSKTVPLEKPVYKGPPKENITQEEIRQLFLVSFEKGMNFLLRRYDERIKKVAR